MDFLVFLAEETVNCCNCNVVVVVVVVSGLVSTVLPPSSLWLQQPAVSQAQARVEELQASHGVAGKARQALKR